jgi:hypothetical protein
MVPQKAGKDHEFNGYMIIMITLTIITRHSIIIIKLNLSYSMLHLSHNYLN